MYFNSKINLKQNFFFFNSYNFSLILFIFQNAQVFYVKKCKNIIIFQII